MLRIEVRARQRVLLSRLGVPHRRPGGDLAAGARRGRHGDDRRRGQRLGAGAGLQIAQNRLKAAARRCEHLRGIDHRAAAERDDDFAARRAAPNRALCSASSRVSGLGATSLTVTTGSPADRRNRSAERGERARPDRSRARIGWPRDQFRQFAEGIDAERDRNRVAIPPHPVLPIRNSIGRRAIAKFKNSMRTIGNGNELHMAAHVPCRRRASRLHLGRQGARHRAADRHHADQGVRDGLRRRTVRAQRPAGRVDRCRRRPVRDHQAPDESQGRGGRTARCARLAAYRAPSACRGRSLPRDRNPCRVQARISEHLGVGAARQFRAHAAASA